MRAERFTGTRLPRYDIITSSGARTLKKTPPSPLSYLQAGVDIAAGDAFLKSITPIAKKTHRAGCLSALGGFGGLFQLPIERYREPVLVAGTDGVGTKLKLAFAMDEHGTVGIDLVAMCANDVVTHGAEPLFFLDYFATGQLQPAVAERVLQGIGRGCELAGVALLGGETAEMPGMYNPCEYDLAGFCVGVAEKSELIDGSSVRPGDVLIGLTSSGLHSNGYSLARKILEQTDADLHQTFMDGSLGSALLKPTKIYVKSILKLKESIPIRAVAHITGGGLPGNLVRVLPDNTSAVIDSSTWKRSPVFDWIQEHGNVTTREMYRTFNCGIGMVVVVAERYASKAVSSLASEGDRATVIGHVESTKGVTDVHIQ